MSTKTERSRLAHRAGQVSIALALALALPGCGSKDKGGSSESDEPTTKPTATVTATATASATPSVSASAVEPSFGPMVTIPAGVLIAGATACATPRVTNEELPAPRVDMNEFRIDAFPYPNDPEKTPMTSVTRDEASALCAARQKRLCTELEWERACKGPDNKTFEYGDKYDKDVCKVLTNAAMSARPKCVSAFGVHDMHGMLFEWTSSAWARGSGSGFAAVRGSAGGGTGVLRDRCAAGIPRKPGDKSKDVGFRCCAGAENAALVDLTIVKRDALEEDKTVDRALAAELLKAMPTDHRTVDQTTVSIDKIWRWRPRDNEELVLARWVGTPSRGKPFFEIAVFKICAGIPARLAAMKGPVEKLAEPKTLQNPEGMTVAVETRNDKGSVKLSYWYGSVKIEEPPFIKPGNQLRLDEEKVRLPLRPILPKLPKKK